MRLRDALAYLTGHLRDGEDLPCADPLRRYANC